MGLVFLPVDVPAQAKKHRLLERGHEDGVRNLPDDLADEPSLAEQEVTGAISVERERCASEAAAHLRAQRDALAQLQTSMDVARLRQSADEALTRLGEIRALWSGEVAELRRKAVDFSTELNEFKLARRLTRAPRLPKDRPMSMALLLLFWVAESAANALFFAAGSDLGYLGGAMLAFCLSAVNVGLGAINGAVFLRRANGNRILDQMAGSLMFVTFACSLIVFNGFVAHYRDLYQSGGEATDVHKALFDLRNTPFDLTSLFSWLLFGAGIAFSVLATWKGFGLDDPFPGYGSHERRRVTSREAYLDARGGVIDEASEVRDEFLAESGEAMEKLRGASARREQLLAARARLMSEFNSVEMNLEQAAQRLLATYRQENVASRTRPPPPHFSRRFAFPDRALDRPEFRALRNDQGLEHDAETLLAELDGLRRRVLDEHAVVLAQAPGEV